MQDTKKLFHYISYLQYPLMLVGLVFCVIPFFGDINSIWVEYNKALVFMGLGISMSTLQDTTTTQNALSKRIYQNPKQARLFLIMIFLQMLFFTALGLYGLFLSDHSPMKDLSLGLISIGIGMVGILKAAGEMAAYQQAEKASRDGGAADQ
jgi:uncharacterized membrane protein